MTEAEWNTCTDPQPMLEFVRGKVSDRRLRLFACACCRTVSNLFPDTDICPVVDISERYADAQVSEHELQAAREAFEERGGGFERFMTNPPRTVWLLEDDAMLLDHAAWLTTEENMGRTGVLSHLLEDTSCIGRRLNPTETPDTKVIARVFRARQAGMEYLSQVVRHSFGNPFRPFPAPPSWPSSVVQLAASLYEGQPCSFALHDALLEAGHAELAEHFQKEEWHPKGCWALDVILGKS